MTVDRIRIAIWSLAMVFMGAVTGSMIEKRLADHWWQAHQSSIPPIVYTNVTAESPLRECQVEEHSGIIRMEMLYVPQIRKER